MYEANKDEGLVILSVNAYQDPAASVQRFVDALKLTYPHYLDGFLVAWDSYSVSDYPAHFFIDRSGKLREFTIGNSTKEKLQTQVDKILAE